MSGFGRGRGGGHGRGGGAIAALRRGMHPPKKQVLSGSSKGALPASRGMDGSSSSSSAANLEESFQLVCAPHPPQFAMVIRLTPGLLDEFKRVEADGGSVSMKFGANSGGHVIKAGEEEYKFSSASEPGELYDIFEEQKAGDDGQGLLTAVGSAWRKISVHRTLSASEKDRMKKRSVEAEKQLKSRKAIVLDSVVKTDAPSSMDALSRRPPLKGKKEPLAKKKKLLPSAPAAKPKPVVKEKPVAPSPPPIVPEPAVPAVLPPALPPGPSVSLVSQPPASSTVRPVTEEIIISESPQNRTAPKQKPPASTASTPEVQIRLSSALRSTDLRNSLIILLTENPRGMTIKAVEKTLGDLAPNAQAGRKNIEKVIKSIATYHTPGKYLLKPGIKPDTPSKPSPVSGSLPDAATADSPNSLVRIEGSVADKAIAASSEHRQPELDEVEKIEVGDLQSPEKSAEGIVEVVEKEVEGHCSVVQEGPVYGGNDHAPAGAPSKSKSGSSGSSGSSSDSDTDSESDSSSGSGSGSSSSSGSESGSSSSSDEDEDVDITSEGENNSKQKDKKASRLEKARSLNAVEDKLPEELHRDASRSSEDIDIGDADDTKVDVDAGPDKIVETIPIELDVISCEAGNSPVKSSSGDIKYVVDDAVHDVEPVKDHQQEEDTRYETIDNTPKEQPRPRSCRDEVPRTEVVSKLDKQRGSRESWRNDSADYELCQGREGFSQKEKPSKEDKTAQRPVSDNDNDTELELGEFREATPERHHSKSDEVRSKEVDTRKRAADSSRTISLATNTKRVHTDDLAPELPSDIPTPFLSEKPQTNLETEKQNTPPKREKRNHPEETSLSARVKKDARQANEVPKAVCNTETKAPAAARKKDNNTSADSYRAEFFAPYEKDIPELRGPIRSYEQYIQYRQEYKEKHLVYLELNKSIENKRRSFGAMEREFETARRGSDKSHLEAVCQKVKAEYQQNKKRFRRMTKTFLVLHAELRAIKDRCADYVRQQA